MKVYGSLKCLIQTPSRFLWGIDILLHMGPQQKKKIISIWLMVVILSHGLVFPDIEPPTIIILHWRSRICCQYGSCSCLFSFVILSKLIIIFNFSFLGILTILLFTLLKHLFHMNSISLHQVFVVPCHFLHSMQSC